MIRKEVDWGEKPPWYYGYTYSDPVKGQNVCHPIPLNLIISILRLVWIAVKYKWPHLLEGEHNKLRRLASHREESCGGQGCRGTVCCPDCKPGND